MLTIDKVLDEIMRFDFSTREMLLEILKKRQTEEARKRIALNALKARTEFSKGKSKALIATEVIKHLQ